MSFSPAGILTFTTDFGTTDAYVGAMRGVALSVAPTVSIHDVSHTIPAQDVRHAGRVLRGACPWFPTGTVHLVVVDPGVGTVRAPIAVRAGAHVFVGPDNGVFDEVVAELGGASHCRRLTAEGSLRTLLPPTRSATFHGRDLFSPAAAAIAGGKISLTDVGPAHSYTPHERPGAAYRDGAGFVAPITHVDHFGNAITELHASDVETIEGDTTCVRLPDDTWIEIVRTYGDAAPGQCVALIGSEGRLEVAVRDGSAAGRLGLSVGSQVWVGPRPRV